MSFAYACLVPGLPHILAPGNNAAYRALAEAMVRAGDDMQERGIRRLFYFSTQWLSVLGHLVQARPQVAGRHVDENWHDLPEVGSLPFDFKVDVPLAEATYAALDQANFQSRLVNYEGFPVDTGTIVADRLLNRHGFAANMLSCCVYSDYGDTERLMRTVTKVIAADDVPTALVVVSGLSGRYFTKVIDPQEDHISDPGDDVWNRRVLALMEQGQLIELEQVVADYARQCKVDMGFKALAVLKGAGIFDHTAQRQLMTQAYGPIYGTGAAVITLGP